MLRILRQSCHQVYTCVCRRSFDTSTTGSCIKSPVLQGARCLSVTPANYRNTSRWDKDSYGMGRKAMKEQSLAERQEIIDVSEAGDVQIEGFLERGAIIPTLETHAQLYDGVRYDELPVVHVKASLNNTILTLSNHNGHEMMLHHSCGLEGFRNIKKSTSVAAQATGYVFGKRAVRLGVHNVRILVRGMGTGRLVSLKGMQMAGLNIVSITDNTPIPSNGPRPRKIRRR